MIFQLDDNDEQQRTPYVLPEKEKMDYLVETLFRCLGLNLLGIDFIIDNKTGHYGVIDINVFPGEFFVFFFLILTYLIFKFYIYLNYFQIYQIFIHKYIIQIKNYNPSKAQ